MKVTIAVGGLLGLLALVFNILILGVGSAAAQTVSPGAASINQPTSVNQPSGANQPGGDGQVSLQDREFITRNAQAHLTEITVGQLAAERGRSDAIRRIGQTLVNDHQQAMVELRNIANANAVTLPTTPNARQQELVDQLSALSGVAFDQAFTSSGIGNHQMSIQEIQQEISAGSNALVRQFAIKYLPVERNHLQLLQQLA
jgi:putative membrane protein